MYKEKCLKYEVYQSEGKQQSSDGSVTTGDGEIPGATGAMALKGVT